MLGAIVLQRAFSDTAPIDEATALFESIIHDERANGGSGGDHFAKAGANDRIWNALEKLCLRDPAVFARYYANPFVAAAADAWLGPHYQMTSQVNVVRPGGAAQQAHRDYHLGFQTVDDAQRYPAHVHTMSPFLTLQGAIAHCDMPVESGPTKLLPYSQRYAPGYLAWRRQDFRDYFESHCVQVPLAKGDALFFQPRAVSRGGDQPHEDYRAHGEPVADFVGVWARDGVRESREDVRGGLSGAARVSLAGKLHGRAARCGDRQLCRRLSVPDQSRSRPARGRSSSAESANADATGA